MTILALGALAAGDSKREEVTALGVAVFLQFRKDLHSGARRGGAETRGIMQTFTRQQESLPGPAFLEGLAV